jgi:opacity protein-like surface antigen
MRRRLLCLTVSGVIQIAAIASAAAADMVVKAPPLPAPVATWTGGFVGASLGYGFSQKTFIDNFVPFGDVGGTDATPKPQGWLGGLDVGYDYQLNWLVLGIEGDFTWTGANSNFSCFPLLSPQSCSASPEWTAALAGRLGIVVGPALLYAKGGPAWAHDTYTDIAGPGAPLIADPGVLFVGHETTPGWTVGGGIEYPFLPNWAVRLEYDYMSFRDLSVPFNGVDGGFFTELIKQNMQMVTVGVDYTFGAPVVAPVPFVTKAPLTTGDVDSQAHVTAFGGVDVSRLSLDAWGGALIAPWQDIDTSGARVWIFAGGGGYKYYGSGTAFHGIYESGDILAGYGFESDNYSINLLGGLNAINDMVTPYDPDNPVQGTEGGFKVRADAYTTPTPQTMTYSEAEYSTAFQTYYLNQKIGYDVTNGQDIYFGPQATLFGDQHFRQWRIGAHLSNLQIDKVEIDLSAGYADDSVVGRGAYSTVEVSRDF